MDPSAFKTTNTSSSFESGYVSVRDENDTEIYRQEVKTDQEINDFVHQYGKQVEGHGLFPTLFCPRRLEGKGFAKDFFLPSLFNFALKVNPIGLRILAGIGATIVDVLTLVPRIAGTFYRLHHVKTHPKKIHPLLSKIQEQPNKEAALKTGRVILQIFKSEIVDTQIKGTTYKEKIDTKEDLHIAIKQLPINKSSSEKTIIKTLYMQELLLKNQWTSVGFQEKSTEKNSRSIELL